MKFLYALGLVVSSYFLYKYKQKSQKLLLVHSNNRLSRLFHLINLKFFEDFRPYLFLFSGHVQTFLVELCGIIIRILKKIFRFYKFKYEREIFCLTDGAKLAVDHARRRNRKKVNSDLKENKIRDKILIILPGVTSTSDDYYIKSFVEDFLEEFDCRVINARGFGGIKLYSPLMISSRCYVDVAEYIVKVCNDNPDKKIFGVGFSFGGMLLARALGSCPDKIPLNFYAGCGICYPNCLESCVNFAENKMYGIYSKPSCNNAKKIFFDNVDIIFHENNIHFIKDKEAIIKEVTGCQVLSDFDKAWTVRSLGLNHIDEYYKDSKMDQYIKDIKVPFLSMFSEDDPIIPIISVPFKALQDNPNTVTVVTQYGGHLGFFGGLFLPQRVLDQPIKSFMKTVEILRDTKNCAENCI